MADRKEKTDDELLLETLTGFKGSDIDFPSDPSLFDAGTSELFGVGDLSVEEMRAAEAPLSAEVRPTGTMYSSQDVNGALIDIAVQMREALELEHPSKNENQITKLLDEKLWAIDQFPRHNALPMPDSPSIDKFREFISDEPDWLANSPSDYMRGIAEAIQAGKSDDEIESLIEKAPISHMPDKLFEGQGVYAAFRGAVGPRLIKASANSNNLSTPEMRWAHRREKTREFDRILAEQGTVDAFKLAWEGSMAMPLEEAERVGVVSKKSAGRVRESFFGRAYEDRDEEGFFIPSGIKDIPSWIERGITKLGIGDVFAPLILSDDDYEDYKRQVKMATPTESWETVVRTVWAEKDKGKSAEAIQSEMQDQLYATFMINSYKDLPASVRLGSPRVDLLMSLAKAAPHLENDSGRPGLARLVGMANRGAMRADLQEALNAVPFGQLPAPIWRGNVPSLDGLVERIYEGADKSIAAIKDTGGAEVRELEKDFMDLLLTTEVRDGEIYVVESTIGRVLRLIGTATETVAESNIVIPGLGWAAITPASRDFYWNYGIRDPNSTYLARVFANMSTGEVGFSRHLADEAMARGYDQGDPAFRLYGWVGLGLDFLVPWEKFHLKAVTTPIRAVHRGTKAVRLTGAPGFRGRAFLAGSSPHLYSYIYKTSERVQKARYALEQRLGREPSVPDLQKALARTGDDILSYNERWLASKLVERMDVEGKKVSFDTAIDGVALSAKTDIFETVGDVAETVVRHVMDSPDGGELLKKMPWQLGREIDHVILAAGADPSIVRESIKAYMGQSQKTHLAALEVLMRKGDPDTQLLRASPEYQAVLKQINDLLDDGEIQPDQVPVLMAILENRAYTLAAESAAITIKEPLDFFKKIKITRSKKPRKAGDPTPAKPSEILSAEKTVKNAQKAVDSFEQAVDGYTKAVLKEDGIVSANVKLKARLHSQLEKILGDRYMSPDDIDQYIEDMSMLTPVSRADVIKEMIDDALGTTKGKAKSRLQKTVDKYEASPLADMNYVAEAAKRLEKFGIDFADDANVDTAISTKLKSLKKGLKAAKSTLKKAKAKAKKAGPGVERWSIEVPKHYKSLDPPGTPDHSQIVVPRYHLFLNASDMGPLSAMFRNKNMAQLLDENGLSLTRIMGDSWVHDLFAYFEHQTLPLETQLPGGLWRALTPNGATSFERVLRQFFFDKSGSIGVVHSQMQELRAQLAGIWMRMRGSADLVVPDIAVRNFWDMTLSPDKVLANEAVGITNRLNGLVRVVRISGVMEEALKAELPARAGRKREFLGVEKNPDVVRQALGLTKDTKEVNAVELYARAVGYTIGEHFKRRVGGMEFTKLTDWTFALPAKARSIDRSINSTMAAILGVPEISNKWIKGIYDADEKVLNLNKVAQAKLRVHLRQLANEPISVRRLPDELMDPNADLGKITNVHLNTIMDIMVDVEGGAFSKRTHYSEAISRSLGYSILNILKAASKETIQASDVGEVLLKKFNKYFTIEDPYMDTLGPMQKALVEKHLKRVQRVQAEVMEMIRVAVKEDPERAIDVVYDKLRKQLTPKVAPNKAARIFGSIHQAAIPGQRKGRDANRGWIQFLTEFTNAERTRNAAEHAALRQEMDLPEAPSILRGEEKMFPHEVEFFDIADLSQAELTKIHKQGGVSKLEYLLKRSSIDELEDLVSDQTKGKDGLSEREVHAFTLLRTYADKTPKELGKLDTLQRTELANAIENVRNSLDHKAQYIEMRGRKIFLSLMGGAGEGLMKNIDSARFAWFYAKFYEGGKGWIEMLDWLVNQAAREGGQWEKRIPKYSPAQAFLEMIVRMRAYEIMDDMAEDMMRHGVPVKMQDFVQPRPRIGPKGDIISIDAGNQFNERVKHYLTEILEFGDTVVQRMHRIYDDEGNVILGKDGKPVLKPGGYEGFRAPRPEQWAPGETRVGWKSGANSHIHDLEAYGTAHEILARFGHRFKSSDWVEMTFPDGSVGLVPAAMKTHIEKTIDRLSSIGWARGTMSARRLTPARVSIPMAIEPEYSRKVRAQMTTAKAVDVLANLFPSTFAHIKMGVTTGIGLPNPAYFTANFMGGALQLFTGTGPVGTIKILMNNPKMTAAVMSRLWKDGKFTPGNPVLVTKRGKIYTADQLTEMAHIYGLKSSFIAAETRRSMAEDVEIELRKRGMNPIGVFRRGMDGARWWQSNLTELATAIDNFYRVSVFIEQVESGVSAGAAAKLARRVAFDYSELSDFEKTVMRNVILFYSYMRKNMDLTIDTLLTNPSRIVGQLRLTRGIQQINLSDDPELVLRNYVKDRMAVGFKKATVNQHMTDKWMYIAPPIPVMDAINLPLNMYGWINDNPDSKRFMITRMAAPWLQYPWADAMNVDPFYAKEIDTYNRVPPWLVEFDKVLLGGTLHSFLDIQEKPNFDPSRRSVEGDYYEGWYHANNGIGWWMYRNLLQIPGTGRSMDTINYLDRSNVGAVEGFLNMSRALRKAAEAVGIAEEMKDPYVGLARDTMGPRVGLDTTDEFLGFLGFKPYEVPTKQAAIDKLIREWLKEAQRQPGIRRQSDWRRPLKRR